MELTIQRGSHGPAVVIQHCAVFGERQRAAQWWMVGEVKPHAQYDCSVAVTFIEPGARRKGYFTITPDNTKYVTVRVDGRVVYDSRTDVPCDMAKWEASAARYRSGWTTRWGMASVADHSREQCDEGERPMNANPDAPRWAGWHRQSISSPWRKIVEGESEAECADLLDARTDGGQTAVLPAGRHPLDRKGE